MKRIWKSVTRFAKNRKYKEAAIDYVKNMEQSEVVQRAPRYPAEQKQFLETQANQQITEEIKKRDDVLIDNLNKFTVISSTVKKRWTSTRDLPSTETEWVHRNDSVWEFGFYEPSPEKIPKGKLTFREALEIMRTRCDEEYALKLDEERRNVLLPQILESLENHSAVKRVDKDTLDTLWHYFRPFERMEKQYVVWKKDLEELRDTMLGFPSEPELPTLEKLRNKRAQELESESLLRLEDTLSEVEKEKLEKMKNMKVLQAKEDERLSQEMEKLGLVKKSVKVSEKG